MAPKRTTQSVEDDSPDPVDVHVGKRLRARRNLVGISQDKLAESTGITFQQIQKYELAKNRVSASRLKQFADILGVKVQYFFDDYLGQGIPAHGLSDNAQEGFDHGEDLMKTKETIDLVKTYYAIPDPKLRKDVMKFMKQLALKVGKDDAGE